MMEYNKILKLTLRLSERIKPKLRDVYQSTVRPKGEVKVQRLVGSIISSGCLDMKFIVGNVRKVIS